MTARPAVAVLLTPRRQSEEVLLVRRSTSLKFFGGYDAFPGGTIDADDESAPVRNVRQEGRAFVAAAARELFEETGVLLTRGAERPGTEWLTTSRRKLLAGEASFSELLSAIGHVIEASDFHPVCRITTPPFTPRRYDTQFFCCEIPEGATVEIWPGELEGGEILSASSALHAWRRGERHVVPPVVLFLMELQSRSVDAALPRVEAVMTSFGRGKLHRIYCTPGVLLAPLKTPTRPPATHTNCYIVGEERLYLVDPASLDPEEQARLWELVDELLSEGRTLEGILLTHYHPDHVGAAAEARRRYRVPLSAHADTIRLMARGPYFFHATGPHPRRAWAQGCPAPDELRTVRQLPALEFDKKLDHGDVLPLGSSPDGRPDWTLTAYHVPGHAPGHLAFEENRYKAILVGDLVSTLSSILVDPEDGDLQQYMRSLAFLEEIAAGTLYPGHGPPARDGKAAVAETVRHRNEREAQLLAALREEPQTTEVLVTRVYTDVQPNLYPLAERSLLSGLIKLVKEGRVVETPQGYRLRGVAQGDR